MEGVSHPTFLVRDFDRMASFMCDGLGAVEVYDSNGKNCSISREKFFVLGGVWIAAKEGAPPVWRSYQHVAFRVSQEDLSRYRERLERIGVEFLPFRSRVPGEGESLYVYDFENHLFWLHCGSLQERLTRYAGAR